MRTDTHDRVQVAQMPGLSQADKSAVSLPGIVQKRSGWTTGPWSGWLFALPALVFYAVFNFWPILTAIRISFYKWNGVGKMTGVGVDNYLAIFTEPELISSVAHAFFLIIFFSFIPVTFALIAAAVMRQIEGRVFGAVARTTLFLPQIIPGAAAAIAWMWMYSDKGLVNQLLSTVGLGAVARPWLADFDWALVAVGVIGTWLLTGFCTLLLMAGIGKIDPTLFEAAQLDGAGPIAEFFSVILPGLRQEIGVCVTLTIIAALGSFEIVYLATRGGPGYQTMVPGVEVYQLAFTSSRLGAASALAVLLAVIIVAVVVPVQRFFREN